MSGLYTGAMGMISNMTKLDVHSNNIANVKTYGFKKDQETFRVFEENSLNKIQKGIETNLGDYNDQVYVDNIKTYYVPGDTQVTGQSLDFVLRDAKPTDQTSFFVVQQDGQNYLTRNGNFRLDANRDLATATGARVMDTQGKPIRIPEGVDISVTKDGRILNQVTQEPIATIQAFTVGAEDLGLLQKYQNGMFTVMSADDINKHYGSITNAINQFDNNETVRRVFGTKERLLDIRNTGNVNILGEFSGEVSNKALENSNVDIADEMVGVMNAEKGVQAGQKVVMTMDKILEKEANQLPK